MLMAQERIVNETENAEAGHVHVRYLIYDKEMRRSGVCVRVRACVCTHACACVSVNIVRLVGYPDLGGGALWEIPF